MLRRRSASSKESIGSDPEEPPTAVGLGVIGEPDEPDSRRLGGLVLARRLSEVVLIGDEVELQVVGLKLNAVRLMITAPVSISILRLEIFQATRSDRRLVSSSVSGAKVKPSTPEGRGKLVLTRRIGEKIMIGDEILVEVADIRSGAVRLRIRAPREIAVDRQEIRDAIPRDGSGRSEFGDISPA
jgi:carbon storage regulator